MINYKEIEKEYELEVYPKREIILVKGKNAKVWDVNGKEYIDCVAGNGVASLGHCNEKILEAINTQAKKLITCPGIFYNDTRALLLEKLISIAPQNLKKVFLCNSGAESVEAAIKFSRFSTQKRDFICAIRGFHGRTMGALSATFNPEYKEKFQPLLPGFNFVPFNNFDRLKEAITENTAGIILEIVQGEGGVYVGKEEYFTKVRKLCTEKEILLIIDEVQTGFCRTGKMFASNHFNLEPDMLCLGKSIAGGIPMGAVLCSDKIKMEIGKHGTTFGGNPLACAGAKAAIDFMLENKLDIQAKAKGEYFITKFTKYKLDKVREIRGLGLMIGIELKERANPFVIKLSDKGILVIQGGATVIRLLPPLTIGQEELDIVIEKLSQVLT